MPKGHKPGREPKRPKKKADKQPILAAPVFAEPEVEVIRKRRKPRD